MTAQDQQRHDPGAARAVRPDHASEPDPGAATDGVDPYTAHRRSKRPRVSYVDRRREKVRAGVAAAREGGHLIPTWLLAVIAFGLAAAVVWFIMQAP